jgi:hypothetical protein
VAGAARLRRHIARLGHLDWTPGDAPFDDANGLANSDRDGAETGGAGDQSREN